MKTYPMFLCCTLALLLTACSEPRVPRALSGGGAPLLTGQPATAQPLIGTAIPQHPRMAANGNSYMHADAYSSDAHPGPGPLGRNLESISRSGSRYPGGSCPIVTVDRSGLLIVLCADVFSFELQLLEPRTLNLLARYPLPSRPSTFHALITLDPDKIMSDTSGAYFYLDEQDRIVYADADSASSVSATAGTLQVPGSSTLSTSGICPARYRTTASARLTCGRRANAIRSPASCLITMEKYGGSPVAVGLVR